MSKNLKRVLLIGAGVLAGLSLSMVSPKAATINQRGNALTSYIKSSHFNFVKNAHYVEPDNYSDNYNQNTNPDRTFKATGGNYKVNYSAYAQLDDQNGNYNPQSVAIDKDGTTYVSYRVRPTKVQIARYPSINNVSDGMLNNVKYGPVFNGGHGQAMALNPKNGQLWLLYNPDGSASSTKLFEISKSSLKPINTVKFHMSPYPMGDTLAFDKNGNAYMCIRTFGGAAPVGSLKLFKGKITPHSVNFKMVQGLRYAPGAIMQNMSYNPSNNRIYFITDGEIMSVPANHYSHLKPSDVRADELSDHYEFEDLAFHDGKGYLLVHYPSELMVSNNHVSQSSKVPKRVAKKANKKATKKHARKNAKKVSAKQNRKSTKKTTKHSNKNNHKKVTKRNNKRNAKKSVKKAVRRHDRKNRK